MSLADQAYFAIREQILRGRYRSGTPLSRRRLAATLGMSIVPVAEAFRRLEDTGLVESRPRSGTRVRMPTERDIRELYELREALESQSARLFAERATVAERLQLRHAAEQIDVLFGRLFSHPHDPEFGYAVHSQHVSFHMRVAEHARSEVIKRMIESNHVLILNWLFDVTGRRAPLPATFHADLADALTSCDSDRADAAMRAHVRYGLAEITGQIVQAEPAEWRARRQA